jgi:hypothetical protein
MLSRPRSGGQHAAEGGTRQRDSVAKPTLYFVIHEHRATHATEEIRQVIGEEIGKEKRKAILQEDFGASGCTRR